MVLQTQQWMSNNIKLLPYLHTDVTDVTDKTNVTDVTDVTDVNGVKDVNGGKTVNSLKGWPSVPMYYLVGLVTRAYERL